MFTLKQTAPPGAAGTCARPPSDAEAQALNLNFDEALFAGAVWPPEWRIVDFQDVFHFPAALELNAHGERAVRKVVVEVLTATDGIDAVAIGGNQRHGAAGARCHLRQPPVPAAVAGGLADEGAVVEPRRLGVAHRVRLTSLRQFVALAPGAREDEADFVPSGTQRVTDIEVPAHEAVARLADLDVVDEHGRESVAVLEAQDDRRMREEVFRNVEFAGEGPVALRNPLDVALVAAPEGIRHQPGGEERRMDVARNGDGAGERGALFVSAVEPPLSGKVET